MKRVCLCLCLLLMAILVFAACADAEITTEQHGSTENDTTVSTALITTTDKTTSQTQTVTSTQPDVTTVPVTTSSALTSSDKTPETTLPVTTVPVTTVPVTTVPVTTVPPVTTAPITYTAENFMIAIDDNTPLSMIALPGTHDSGATVDMILAGTAKCQTLTIAEQLAAGVRYFDIRLRRVNGALHVYHGTVDQKLSFDEVLTAFYTFLDKNPSEALIVCIKEESDAEGENQAFDTMVKAKLSEENAKWYTGSDIPTLGKVRGKCVLMRRFGTSGSYGFDASHDFADNSSDFTITNGAYKLRAQDYYQNDSGAAKWTAVETFFNVMKTPDARCYYLNNTSGYKPGLFSIPNINTIKDHVNPLLLSYLEEKPALVGIIATDFMTPEIAEAIWSLNFS